MTRIGRRYDDRRSVALAAEVLALRGRCEEYEREIARLTEPFVARDQLPAAFDLMKARAEAAEAEVLTLREALEAAKWYVQCLEDVRNLKVVRGLGEAQAVYRAALAAAQEQTA